jgi:ATP-dependent RNA helicase RhlB
MTVYADLELKKMKFTEFNLDEKILKGIEKAGFEKCTNVQVETFKSTLKGKDILVQSQTGTGKTAAFIISIFHLYLTREEMKNRKVLILAPTRELVLQIEKEAKLLGSFLDFRIGSFYGGVGYTQQENLLKEGVDIIVGTPGRLMDFAGSGKIKFGEFGIIIIDEADRMFDMGFFPDIKRMIKRMVPPSERISMLFSATLSLKVKNLAWEYMNDPAEVNISAGQITVDKIKQVLYHVGTNEKINLLLGLLKYQNPSNVLIFTNTKQDAVKVAARLAGNGYECDYIIGDLPQKKRTKIIDSIKSGKLKYLVATDVAARGLHINDLDLVINYDIPEDFENYVHRIGRTARAGKSGIAVTFACEKFVYGLEAIESFIKMKIPVEWAADEMFVEDKSTGEFIRNFMKESKQIRLITENDDKKHEKKVKDKKNREKAASQGTEKKKHPKAAEKARPITDRDKKNKIPTKVKSGISLKEEKEKVKEKAPKPAAERTPKNLSLDKRMDYYKERYGEDFSVKREIIGTHVKKKESKISLITRIKSIFKRK